MSTLELPASDLVSDTHPFVARLEVIEDPLPPSVTLRISLHRAGERRESPALGTETACDLSRHPDRRQVKVVLDVGPLAPGEYSGELTLDTGIVQRSWPISFFRLPRPMQEEFPFGVYALPPPVSPAEEQAMWSEMRAAGINLICQHLFDVGAQGPVFDRAARHGIRFMPSMAYAPHGKKDWPAENQCVMSDGSTGRPCLNQPAIRAMAAGNVAACMRSYLAHPAFSRMVYFGDDLFLDAAFKEGRAALSCYCPTCREGFRKQAGVEPPKTTDYRLGPVAPDDPWLAWMRYRCETDFAQFVRGVEAAKDSVDPGIRIGLCHGWPDNPFTSVATGIYAPLTQPTTVVSSYAYPFLRSPAADFICHYETAKMGNRDKDVWMLGLFGADGAMAPPWQIRQNYWNMLAAGYKFIAFFSWWDYGLIMKNGDEESRRRAQEALAVLSQCGAHKDWILPTARYWQMPAAPHALLYSFTTEAFDIAPVNRGHQHLKRVAELYRLALRSQIPMQIVCEEEVRAGVLDRFETVCLHDVRVLPTDVKQVLDARAAAGKAVFVDADYLYTDGWHPGVKLEIPGATELSAESMVNVLRDRTARAVDVSNGDVTVRRFRSGTVDYFVFVNNYPDRYWGMPYSYGEPKRNDERAGIVKDLPVEATVRFGDKARWLFDLSTGESLGSSAAPLSLRLEPSWGRVVAALPSRSATLRATMAPSFHQGETARLSLELLDADGRRLPGAFTVRVTWMLPSGRVSLNDGFVGIQDGFGEFPLPIAANDEVGPWQLVCEGGLPRQKVSLSINVLAGNLRALALQVQE